ncbi:MAG: RNB domain-containing ribonuclease [Desulfomonile tiedjei]|uniref:RNB domain-containing ribonuclease n=1 Tax=Desulfomonile tiedjei TaxID=2358 RepID=A0A9D6V398_9BACT|nr:RNB domain-containing ribonuclease [Desulfomonile tiedjei]
MSFQKNNIVDYYDNRRISCGLIIEVDDRKLRVLNDQGKEARISPTRTLISGKEPGFPLTGSRDEQVNRLKEISAKRENLKTRIDLRELWEVVGQETREIDIDDLSELFFGNENDSDSTASLLRAIFEDRLYFKIRPDTIEVPTQNQVEQALIQREKEQDRARFIAESAEFLLRLKSFDNQNSRKTPDKLISMLEEAALHGPDWVLIKPVKEIFSQAGLTGNWDPFRVLVKLGHWSEDENITLRAEGIQFGFSTETEAAAQEAAQRPLPIDAEDLLDEKPITIDALSTRDVDDALSVSSDGPDLIVGIHITDVTHFVDHNSLLDHEVRERTISIYLPEKTIPMMPRILSEQAASLEVGAERPALSVMVRFGPDLELLDYRLTNSIIKVDRRLTYEEADERIADPGSPEAAMFAVASAVRRRRVDSGAIIFKDPEVSVRVDENGNIEVSTRDRETPAQILVSEMMILANNLFARYLYEHNVPGIFRSQPPPLEKIELGEEHDPVQSYRCKKVLSRGDLSTEPAPHSTLGLEMYTTASSPLRRYTDLIVQRQLKAALGKRQPLGKEELERILDAIQYRLERAVVMERERQKYFLLKYLEQRKSDEFEVVVLNRFPKFFLVQITQLSLNAVLHVSGGTSLTPGERLVARIEKINPRDDRLTLSLVRWVRQ